MNQKQNPLVSLAALLLLVVILVLTCTGCATETEAAPTTGTTDRLTTEFAGYTGDGGRMVIITDTYTGVQYLVVTNNGTALTVLQTGEG